MPPISTLLPNAVVRLERPALIAALEIVRVLDQVDVEGALRVRDLAGRKVRPRDVEVVEVAEDPVDAHAAALSNQAADASGVLHCIRRIERAPDERVHARDVCTSHGTIGATVGIEPVEHLLDCRV